MVLPSQILNLTFWALSLPFGNNGVPETRSGSSLLTYSSNKYFYVPENVSAVAFKTYTNGLTYANTKYPRTEMRETSPMSWNTSSGYHLMNFSGCVTRLPSATPKLVLAQIHHGDDDLIRIRCLRKYGIVTIDVSYNDQEALGVLDSNYTLKSTYNIQVEVFNNTLNVFYNTRDQAAVTLPVSQDNCFFKIGCYPQSDKKSSTDFGETWVYSVNTTHTV